MARVAALCSRSSGNEPTAIEAASLLPCGWFQELAKLILCINDVVHNSPDVEDLLNVRLVTKDIKACIEGDDFQFTANAFNTLHMNRRLWSFDEQLSIRALQNAACFYNHSTYSTWCSWKSLEGFYTFDPSTRSKTSLVSVTTSASTGTKYSIRHSCKSFEGFYTFDSKKKSIWMQVFAALGSILTLSISAPGQPDWHKFSSGEEILGSIIKASSSIIPPSAGGDHRPTRSPLLRQWSRLCRAFT